MNGGNNAIFSWDSGNRSERLCKILSICRWNPAESPTGKTVKREIFNLLEPMARHLDRVNLVDPSWTAERSFCRESYAKTLEFILRDWCIPGTFHLKPPTCNCLTMFSRRHKLSAILLAEIPLKWNYPPKRWLFMSPARLFFVLQSFSGKFQLYDLVIIVSSNWS